MADGALPRFVIAKQNKAGGMRYFWQPPTRVLRSTNLFECRALGSVQRLRGIGLRSSTGRSIIGVSMATSPGKVLRRKRARHDPGPSTTCLRPIGSTLLLERGHSSS